VEENLKQMQNAKMKLLAAQNQELEKKVKELEEENKKLKEEKKKK